ncbi:MAG: YfhO family protein [Anaerolineae bacterium]|nr:YfhO family protein [Anaerolineae bacterium]
MTTRNTKIPRADLMAVIALVLLWLLFFWRLFTPIAGDQASLKQGDFSGQFVAFGAYQYQRFTQGEVPLWDPYNNGGLPFIADTQAAVFYPPRLLTIALASFSGGWSYHALELEMTFHVLLYSLMMYGLVRRLTLARTGSIWGGLIAAIIAAYGGYLSGYPPLQLALLEAGIWLPLAVVGILEASRSEHFDWRWLLLTGFALGLSWLAGHPQTSWFLTGLLVLYLAYRSYGRYSWRIFVGSTLLIGLLSAGIAAVQLLPGFEYLAHTARVDLTYDAKGNGFPFRDLIQLIYPGIMSLFSPLYVGVTGLALALVGIWRGKREGIFWGVVALIALGLSFGANSTVFPLLYNLLPGLRFFRGQERAAYLIANSLAILAGLGVAGLLEAKDDARILMRVRRGVAVLLGIIAFGAAIIFSQWLHQQAALGQILNISVFSTLIAAALFLLIWWLTNQSNKHLPVFLLAALTVFELFSINMNTSSNYDPTPPTEQLSMTPPPLVAAVIADADGVFRVDGFRGLHDNYGSLYRVLDMRGISPLFLDGPFRIIEPDKINPLAWELFAVRYAYSDWEQLPVESEIVTSGEDRFGTVNLHRLTDPRPFVHLVTQVAVADSDEFANALLHDPNFDPRSTVILETEPDIELDEFQPENATAEVTDFQPEAFTIQIDTPENAILSIAHPGYPGWQATIDDTPAPILRAYGALSALEIPAGEHSVRFTYDPLSYRIGVLLSLFTWVGIGILALWFVIRRSRYVQR